jgi:hypothetical protein
VKYPELTFPSQFSIVDLNSKAVLAFTLYKSFKFFAMHFRSSFAVGFEETNVAVTGMDLNLDRKRPSSIPDELSQSTRNYGICFDDSRRNFL